MNDMSESEFRSAFGAQAQAQGHSEKRIRDVLRTFIAQRKSLGLYGRADLCNALEWIGIPLPSVTHGESRMEVGRNSLRALVDSARLREAIAPWIDEVRREMERLSSKKVSLPFAKYEQALDWLREESPGAPPEEVSSEGTRSYRTTLLFCRDPSGAGRGPVFKAGEGSPRNVLATSAKRMADASGLEEMDLVETILTGEEAALVPVVVRSKHVRAVLPTGGSIARTEVSITYRNPEVSSEDSRKIHRALRSAWGAERTKPLTKLDQALWEIIREVEDIPRERGTIPAFWEEVKSEMEARGFPYQTWRGPYNAYARLEKKLNRFTETTPPSSREEE